MRKAEVEAVKSVSVMWLVALTSALFMLGGCVGNTMYFSNNETQQEGSGPKSVDNGSTATQDAEGNTPFGLEGSIPTIGGTLSGVGTTLTKPVTVDNSQVDNSTDTQTTTPADQVVVDEVDDDTELEEGFVEETD